MIENKIIDCNYNDKILIGRVGENIVRSVKFDLTDIKAKLPNANISLIYQRATDSAAYPIGAIVEDNVLTWTISDSDTAVAGWGRAELVATENEAILLSKIYDVFVNESLYPVGEVPEPIQYWYQAILEKSEEVEVNRIIVANDKAEIIQLRNDVANDKADVEEVGQSVENDKITVVQIKTDVQQIRSGFELELVPISEQLSTISGELPNKANSSDVYTKTQADTLLNAKADKQTTYTKTETDNLLEGKADKSNVYTSDEVDSLLDSKANADTTYTKAQVDTALSSKANANNVYTKNEVDAVLEDKADSDDVYTKTETDSLVSPKANSSDVYTKTQTDTLLDEKADQSTTYTKSEVDTALGSKADSDDVYTKTEVDNALDLKADSSSVYTKTQTDNLLNGKANTGVSYTKSESDTLLGAKADVSSVYTKTSIDSMFAPIAEHLEAVDGIIPEQASSTNQLADKEFVNSSIATNTAYFQGTFDSVEELEALTDVTNNDYAFVVSVDSEGNSKYDRYKYNADDLEWVFEYTLNNSSFTAEQWSAINSGATAESITQISTNASAIETINGALVNKADKSTTYTKTQTDTLLSGKVDKENGKGLFSGNYDDLTNKPSIPSISGLASETYVNNAVSTKANASDVYSKDEADDLFNPAITSATDLVAKTINAGITYITTAPTAANANGIKIVVLTSEPTTKYAGYLYLITG